MYSHSRSIIFFCMLTYNEMSTGMTSPYEQYPHAQNDATTRPAQSEIETTPAQYMSYQSQTPPTASTQFDLWEHGPIIPPPPPQANFVSLAPQDHVSSIQQLAATNAPITTANNPQRGTLKNIFIGILKSILYFLGMLMACFGLFATTSARGTVAIGMTLLICLVALVLVTILFYKRRYYLNTLKWKHYLWWILGSTIVTFVLIILDEIIAEKLANSPTQLSINQDIFFGPTFVIYGVILVITAFRKSSTTNRLPSTKR